MTANPADGDCACGHPWRDHDRNTRGDGYVCRDIRGPEGPSCPGCRIQLAELDDPATMLGAIRVVVLNHACAYWIPGMAGREFWSADGQGFDMEKIHRRAGAWADQVAPRIAAAIAGKSAPGVPQ